MDMVLWVVLFLCVCVVEGFCFPFLKNSVTHQDVNFKYPCML